MGVSGSGKSTIAEGVATGTGWTFAEADGFHPRSNIDKMTSGTPLTDEDRAPWLRDLSAWMGEHAARDEDTVIACSALKRAYRDVLRGGVPTHERGHRVVFAHVAGPAEVIAERMQFRSGHFMPTSLLQSQTDDLEPLEPDEDGFVLDLRRPAEELIEEAVAKVRG